jgi:hypothetical protein
MFANDKHSNYGSHFCIEFYFMAHSNAIWDETSGLYYKRITIVIDAPSVVSKWRSKL